MPRVANTGAAVADWFEYIGEPNGMGTSTFDICNSCNADPDHALTVLEPYAGDPKGTELEEVGFAPCFEQRFEENEPATCEVCEAVLRAGDN